MAIAMLSACSSERGSAEGRVPGTFPSPSPTVAPTTVLTQPTPSSAGTPTTATPGTAAPPDDPQLDSVRLRLTEIGTFDQPVAIVERDGVLYVAEQAGRVVAVAGGATHDALDMTDRTRAGGERGLLDLAFSPDGGHLYVSYTNNDGDSRIDEYVMAGDQVDAGTRREVFALDQPYPNHNGGGILFGRDGMLYAGYGDGGSGGDPQRNGQNPGTLLGKLLRIDPRPSADAPYTVPPDNPYVGASGVRPEIWSSGLRNPWRFSFDAVTGDLWVADVGQNAIEEIDHVPAAHGGGRGTNFGWSAYEGSARYNEDQDAPDAWMPILEYRHGADGCSISGGVVYRGRAIPALRGAYLYGDYCAGNVRAVVAAPDGTVSQSATLSDAPEQVVSFGTDAAGEVYVVSLGGGIYRLDPA